MGEHKVRPYIGLANKKMRNLFFEHSLINSVRIPLIKKLIPAGRRKLEEKYYKFVLFIRIRIHRIQRIQRFFRIWHAESDFFENIIVEYL